MTFTKEEEGYLDMSLKAFLALADMDEQTYEKANGFVNEELLKVQDMVYFFITDFYVDYGEQTDDTFFVEVSYRYKGIPFETRFEFDQEDTIRTMLSEMTAINTGGIENEIEKFIDAMSEPPECDYEDALIDDYYEQVACRE